jgi:hypothetical protein
LRTLSFHAGTAGKVQQSQVVKSLCHTQRKTYGRYQNHKNEDIDKAMTQYNLDFQFQGGRIETVISDRLEKEYTGKKKIRKDAVVLREIIASPSSELFEGMTIEQQQKTLEKFIRDAKPWFEKEFGKKNVLGASGHLDETNPHVHFMVMPLTKDGRLSQKDFFKNPTDMKRQHREFRKHMNSKKWAFDLDNKYEKAEGVPLPAYKANAKSIEEKRAQQTQMIGELNDTGWRERAEQAALYDIHVRVLRKEYERLDKFQEDLERRSERLKASEDDIKAASREIEERDIILVQREQDMTKRNRLLTAVAVAILESDLKRVNTYSSIREKGLEFLSLDELRTELIGSINDISCGLREKIDIIQVIENEIDL